MAGEDLIQIQAIGLFEAQQRLSAMQRAAPLAPMELVRKASEVLTRALVAAAPKRTGDMAESIASEIGDSPMGAVASWKASRVAQFVIKGTRPHDIWAGYYGGNGSAHVLHFETDGGDVFSPYVRHPGTKANDFRKKAWDEVRGEVMALLRESGRGVMRSSTIG